MRFVAALALTALALAIPRATLRAQDTVASSRHLLSLDISRVKPLQRSYDMIVHVGDSSQIVGQRDVSLALATYAGNAAWLLVETRTGLVPAAETLYLASDMRPIHWASSLGASRLSAEFAGDSIFGATTTPAGKHSLLLVGRPDLLVSLAMVETLMMLLPLDSAWADSAAVLAVDATSGAVLPAELAVVGRESNTVHGSPGVTDMWIVSLRSEASAVSIRVIQDGDVVQLVQSVPSHVGRAMEYRRRPDVHIPPPPLPPE